MRETTDKAGEGKGNKQRSVVALKGQLLHWRLLVANAGQHQSSHRLAVRLASRVAHTHAVIQTPVHTIPCLYSICRFLCLAFQLFRLTTVLAICLLSQSSNADVAVSVPVRHAP